MARTRLCTLLTLAEPTGTETMSFALRAPIVPYTDRRLMVALKMLRFVSAPVCVGDGTYGAYADVYCCTRNSVKLGMVLAGEFEACPRIFALALAQDIVARGCGVPCNASVICCEAAGVRSVPLPAEYVAAAKQMLQQQSNV